jgi:hypothetical protein
MPATAMAEHRRDPEGRRRDHLGKGRKATFDVERIDEIEARPSTTSSPS